jgi:hypothetical protein
VSNAVFPSLLGIRFPVSKQPFWSTKVQTAANGQETRIGYWSSPRWRYTIGYEVLRDASGTQDLQTLAGFYNARMGQFDDFLFLDPDDNTATAKLFGTGNGTTNAFQLTRALGGFSEPVLGVNTIGSIVRTDWQGALALTGTTRANYIKYSGQLDNSSYWGQSSVTVTANTDVAPDGTTTGDTLTFTTTTGQLYQITELPCVNGGVYTFSVWLKGTAGQTMALYGQSTGGQGGAAQTLTLTSSWARYQITLTMPGSGTSGTAQFNIIRNSGTAASCRAWGGQVETGATPTSYIPTLAVVVSGADYTVSATGLVTVRDTPVAGATLVWSGTYYWRVRFDDMDFTLEKLMQGLWDTGDILFTSVK